MANVPSLARELPHELATKAAKLRDEFKQSGVRISQRDYDRIAILSLLSQHRAHIVESVLTHRKGLDSVRPKIDKATTFDLAVSITFLELVGEQVDAATLSGTKALIDMQAIIAAQQAVLVCGGAAVAATAASSG